jgi:ribosomal protein L9
MVLLREPIKKIGTQKIPIHIYTDVEPVIEVEVVPE